jgi:hypothetical protein
MTVPLSTYAHAWEALRLYREEMRTFVISNLQAKYGDLWMAQGVERLYPPQQIDELRRILGQRGRAGQVVVSQAESLEDMLDVSHFKVIIEGNWKPVFLAVLKELTILNSWIAEVTTARNALAHWANGEMPRKDALRVIDTCERIVRSINPIRANDLLSIWDAVDGMGRQEPIARRATIVFEDGAATARVTLIFDEPQRSEGQ